MLVGIERLRDRLAELGYCDADFSVTTLLYVTLVAWCLRYSKAASNFHHYMNLRLFIVFFLNKGSKCYVFFSCRELQS